MKANIYAKISYDCRHMIYPNLVIIVAVNGFYALNRRSADYIIRQVSLADHDFVYFCLPFDVSQNARRNLEKSHGSSTDPTQ